jgi:hypothetical protein
VFYKSGLFWLVNCHQLGLLSCRHFFSATLESVEATAESTSTAPVATAQSKTTTPVATATTPLATVESTVTEVSTIDSRKKPPLYNLIIDNLIKLNTSASGKPIKVSAFDLCSATGVMYNKFDVLTNRKFTVQQ